MKIRRFAESRSMMTEAAAVLSGALAQSSARPFAVMLAGGQTPMKAYERFAGMGTPISPHAHVFFSDERYVPFSSPESNAGRILPFLHAAGIPDERIFRVNTDLELDKAADHYDQTLRSFIGNGGRVQLGFLGVGTDGHTASLFSPADLERGQQRFAVVVPRPTQPDRISVTPMLLKYVDHIIFLAAGTDKARIVEEMVRNPQNVIATRAVAQSPHVELWLSPTV